MSVDPRAQHGEALTPDTKTHEALLDTFPASDPQAKEQTGARAVPAAELMPSEDAAKPHDATTLNFEFADRTKAKLAVEQAVRDAVVERGNAAVEDTDAGGARVVLDTAGVDAERAAEAMRKAGGEQR